MCPRPKTDSFVRAWVLPLHCFALQVVCCQRAGAVAAIQSKEAVGGWNSGQYGGSPGQAIVCIAAVVCGQAMVELRV